MVERVEVGPDHGITIPLDARQRLGIEAGTHVLVEVRDGYLIVIPEPSDYAARLRGLHQEIWAGEDPREYVLKERSAWPD